MSVRRASRSHLMLAAVIAAVALSACGQPNKVGNEEMLEGIEEREEKCRLGESCPSPATEALTPDALALGKASPTPEAEKEPQVQYYELALTSTEGSWYRDEIKREDISCLSVVTGTNLRVTNKDTEPNRPYRTFTASNGDFASPRLKVGESWTRKFDQAGEWQVESEGAPFIILSFKVGIPCSG